MSEPATVQKIWASMADEWDSPNAGAKQQYIQYYKPFIHVMEKFMPKTESRMVLEAGCGSGTFAVYMAQKWGSRCVCLDFVNECLVLAKKKFKAAGVEGDFIQADMQRLPFKEGAFDMVFNQGTVEHFALPGRQLVLDEMSRVSSKHVAIFVPNNLNPMRAIAKRVQKLVGTWRWGLELPYSTWELERRLNKAGVRVTKKAGVNFYKIWYTYWPFRLFVYPFLRWLLGERLYRINGSDGFLNRYFGDEIFQLAVKDGKPS